MLTKTKKKKAVPVMTNPPLTFDIERLASEIDDVFQEKVEKNIDYFRQTGDQIILDNLEVYRSIIAETIKNSRDALFKEFEKEVCVITIPEKNLEVNIGRNDHPKFANVVQSLSLTGKALLVGPAGTGKTYMVNEIATRMKLSFYKYSCSRDSSVHDLLGYKQPTSETYLETVFLKAYEGGGIFLVDEYDAMSGDMSLFFNGVTDGSKFISVPHRDSKPIAMKHSEFYIVMCGNTWGKGSHQYSGRDFQDQALLDRFRLSKHYVGYHEQLERRMCNEASIDYNFMKSFRVELENHDSYLSTRNVEEICKLKIAGITMDDIVQQILSDFSENEKNSIKSPW